MSLETAFSSKLTLALTMPANNGANILTYRLERSNNGQNNYQTVAASITASYALGAEGNRTIDSMLSAYIIYHTHVSGHSTFHIDPGPAGGLSGGTSYQYRLYASNSEGESVASSAVTATTNAAVQPDAPVLNAALHAETSNSITIGFNAPSDFGGSPVTSYTLQRLVGGNYVNENVGISASDTQSIASGLDCATSYTFRLLAVNAAGTSPSVQYGPVTTSANNAPVLAGITGTESYTGSVAV
jgi:hypothetical protein